MGRAIVHFMWGYQPHFCTGQECSARRLFGILDQRFAPKVFLVGVLVDKRGGRFPACVEPEDDFWIQSEEFNSAIELAETIRPSYPESKLFHSHPLAQQWHDDALTRRAIKDAVQRTIDAKSGKPPGMSYFVSEPAKVEGYLVSVVLGLQTGLLNVYPSLAKTSVPMHKYRTVSVSTSLIDATVKTFLDRASGELRLPDPGCALTSANAEDILRESANKLIHELAYRADDNRIEGWHTFFSSCNNIARTHYERAAAVGTMVLAKADHQAIRTIVGFPKPTGLRVARGARKLLQLASGDLALHTDSERVYGLVKIVGYDGTEENLFTIRFLGHDHWEVAHTGTIMMGVKHGQPYLPAPPFNEEKLRKDLPRILGEVNARDTARIVSLVHQATREQHGTMLLITQGARQESERLCTQCMPIRPRILTPGLLRSLTPIDGAVLLSPKGTCYAVGAILDGMACEAGDPGRGARYNSAVRYVRTSKHPCMAIVVSEDGGVEFIPDPKPAIRRSEIEAAIRALQEMVASPRVTRRKYAEAMEWLREHRFYLLPSDCAALNTLRASIEDRFQAQDPSGVRLIEPEFTPDPAMCPELYYEGEDAPLSAL